jgi:hypothetical protein
MRRKERVNVVMVVIMMMMTDGDDKGTQKERLRR